MANDRTRFARSAGVQKRQDIGRVVGRGVLVWQRRRVGCTVPAKVRGDYWTRKKPAGEPRPHRAGNPEAMKEDGLGR